MTLQEQVKMKEQLKEALAQVARQRDTIATYIAARDAVHRFMDDVARGSNPNDAWEHLCLLFGRHTTPWLSVRFLDEGPLCLSASTPHPFMVLQGPKDETCVRCGKDPRNEIHEVTTTMTADEAYKASLGTIEPVVVTYDEPKVEWEE